MTRKVQLVNKADKSQVFFTGWHWSCGLCDSETINAGSQGLPTRAAAEKALRIHQKNPNDCAKVSA